MHWDKSNSISFRAFKLNGFSLENPHMENGKARGKTHLKSVLIKVKEDE